MFPISTSPVWAGLSPLPDELIDASSPGCRNSISYRLARGAPTVMASATRARAARIVGVATTDADRLRLALPIAFDPELGVRRGRESSGWRPRGGGRRGGKPRSGAPRSG